jgi:transcriptional regulator with XRE-family HTH domain
MNEALKELSLSHAQLAAGSGLDEADIDQLVFSSDEPNIVNLKVVCEFLGIPLPNFIS